jgi:hypothetical protein
MKHKSCSRFPGNIIPCQIVVETNSHTMHIRMDRVVNHIVPTYINCLGIAAWQENKRSNLNASV